MLEWFIYPVSGIMRLWHWLFTSTFGLAEDTAWIASIFALVVTVRSLIAPFFWMQSKSARLGVLMRPHQYRIREEYGEKTDRESIEKQRQLTKELAKEYNYNALAGCVPALIQVPVFLGLYQVLLRMARPTEGLDTAEHAPIGLLTSDNVRSFLEVRINDVPLPAYIAMSDEALNRLGTTQEAVQNFITPWLLAACAFTMINMLISVIRNRYTTDHDIEFNVKMNNILVAFVVIAPLMLLMIGITGPIPVAIILYWFANNTWTFLQTALVYTIITLRYPFDQEHKNFQASRRAQRQQRRSELRAYKRSLRSHRIRSITQPSKAAEHRQALKDLKQERIDAAAAEKARKKEIRKQRSAIESELTKERMNERVERIRAKRAAKRGMSADDARGGEPAS
ncbi:membrane protein insertase YidC [Corynebacterium kozikiae]|uniref:membrane protein insertase YidC n=1 Tax=Corynebacterium kozikiae TaxID=2968469 RepID=UPI00211C9A03|nr:membrane protein insertase YidC [Corynebacterium sp. 76QC2CO]MCQ9343050.1 membrane protein insertase YidC [Corynebacterium sp. 76QC2CO]